MTCSNPVRFLFILKLSVECYKVWETDNLGNLIEPGNDVIYTGCRSARTGWACMRTVYVHRTGATQVPGLRATCCLFPFQCLGYHITTHHPCCRPIIPVVLPYWQTYRYYRVKVGKGVCFKSLPTQEPNSNRGISIKRRGDKVARQPGRSQDEASCSGSLYNRSHFPGASPLM